VYHTSRLLLHQVEARKMKYFGHILRQPKESIEHAAMTGLTEGSRIRSRPRTSSWIDNICQWSRLRESRLLETERYRQHWHEVVRHCSQPSHKGKGKGKSIAVCETSPHSYGKSLKSYHMGSHQCYLPLGRGDFPAFTPAEAGTRLSDPEGM